MIGADRQPRAQNPLKSVKRDRIPIWRRVTALFTLSFMSVLGGLLLAAILGMTALMLLFLLERAIAT